MSEAKFTEGEWKVAEGSIGFIYELNEFGSNKWWLNISASGKGCASEEEIKDIANVMSQANKMYELLIECRTVLSNSYEVVEWPHNGSTDCDKMICKIDKLLAKARGGN